MSEIFTIKDRANRIIRLNKKEWRHIVREHPFITIEEIKETLLLPLIIKDSFYDQEGVKWYYRFNKVIKRYTFVSVKYLNGDGFVITAFRTRKIK